MPIYEYLCESCGEKFEVLTRGAEKPQCPACDSKQLTKQFSTLAVHTSSGQGSSCLAQQAGACDPSYCCGQGCGLKRSS